MLKQLQILLTGYYKVDVKYTFGNTNLPFYSFLPLNNINNFAISEKRSAHLKKVSLFLIENVFISKQRVLPVKVYNLSTLNLN